MLTIGQNHLALLQVGILEKAVVLVGEAHFVRLVAALAAYFTYTGHWGKSFVASCVLSGYYLSIKKSG
jgi:hypothetical protein